jgi:hypothetical protein
MLPRERENSDPHPAATTAKAATKRAETSMFAGFTPFEEVVLRGFFVFCLRA